MSQRSNRSNIPGFSVGGDYDGHKQILNYTVKRY